MKTQTIKLQTMRTLLLLLLFVSGFAYAQPPINNPSPYYVCDDNTNGFAAFDINIKTPTIITQAGTQVAYYLTLADSQAAINPINLTVPFTNTNPFNQTIYIRAWDVADPSNPAYSTLNLVVSQKPTATISNNSSCAGSFITVTTSVSPFGSYNYAYTTPQGIANPGNVATFSTTADGSYNVAVTDTTSGCVSNVAGTYVYFTPLPVVNVSATSICDGNPAFVSTTTSSSGNTLTYSWTIPFAANNPGSSPNFLTSIPGIYSVVVTDNGTGCTSTPVSVTVNNQTSSTPTFSISPSVCSGFILPTTSDNGIAGTWSPSLATSGTYLFTPSYGQCATSYSTSIIVNQAPNANQAPNLVQNSNTNNVNFDLSVQSNIILGGQTGSFVNYYISLADAQANVNQIPTIFTNTTSPQTIYASVTDPSAGCKNFTSFNLVVNNPNNVYIPDANFKSRLISLGVDTNADSEIQFTEASAITSELNVNNSFIADLTGFEAFTNVPILRCASNSLSALNLSNLPNLKTLECGGNSNLSSLILTNLASLDTLRTYHTNLSSLDINNLTTLKHLDCSYNHISTLNVSNLTSLKILNCAFNSLPTIDVTPLILLEELNCSVNQLATINVNPLVNLKTLICSNNGIQTLSLNNLPNLEHLEYAYNQSSSLSFSNLPMMKYINCSGNYFITTLNPSVLPLLEYLTCNSNALTTLNVNGLTHLNYLDCGSNQLTSLNVTGLNSLATLYAYNNYISTIDLTNLPSLATVYIPNNQLTSLTFTGSNVVNYIYCSNNLLTSLNISGLVNLNYLNCQQNTLTTLNFAGLTGLGVVLCDHNLLTSLDFTTASYLYGLSCSNNNLNSINIKNGSTYIDTNSYYTWSENPGLTFVCTDEGESTAVQQILNQSTNINNGNIVFNTYCSFIPGGNYNTITGTVRYDNNNNGCDTNDDVVTNFKIGATNWSSVGATFTNNFGQYTFFTSLTDQSITPELENPSYFNVTPSSSVISFPSNNNLTQTQDFCLSANGLKQDLEIVIEPITPARPGFYATYKIVYKNKGNNTVTGNFNFNYNDALLDFTSATVTPSSQNTGVLNWNYTNLLPFESNSFYVTLYVNSPTATPPVTIGTLLNFDATINPVATDENQADNHFTYSQLVVGSYDPNEITCLEGDSLSPTEIGNYLHYGIRFENTGTYLAENIVVRDVIDTTKYDINSIQLLNTSHPAYTRITGNVVEFIFQNINLTASSGTPPVGGHGDVLFKIKSLNSLVAGDFVEKTAKIYFDYNAPIDTNVSQTTYAVLSNTIHQVDSSVSVYPNPTRGTININCNSSIKSIEIYDVQGRILETAIENSNSIKFDISEKQNGIYFLKINTESGSKVEKIVKE